MNEARVWIFFVCCFFCFFSFLLLFKCFRENANQRAIFYYHTTATTPATILATSKTKTNKMSRSGRLRRLLGSLTLLLCSFLGSVVVGAAVTFAATTKTSNSSSSSATTTDDNHSQEEQQQQERTHLKVILKRDFLDRVPSCRHTFSQIELSNTVSFPLFLLTFSATKREEEEEKISLHVVFGLVWFAFQFGLLCMASL